MAARSTTLDSGWKAVDFRLPGIDGQTHALADSRGRNGTLIMFICNHCPYVRAVIDRVVRDCRELEARGVKAIAIMPNDITRYPDDGFDNMKRFAAEHGFGFPYLIDETQEVARAYDAVCTPEFLGFNADLELCYRGRLDASKVQPIPNARRELFEAMVRIAETGKGPTEQIPSMGCSIKWK
ncbi:alkyl hydroperoxide reductase [Skermanella stibiiresistens SB22]|uniref:Alkyl hydroperoxide reductase n=1 Tax=Skermanella stibiiresistens SB22 TaxID=1385369 RepID=W9H5E4_9PROT|nr:thioredoxin family protein [Skermanella stibiiresistens]EWY40006.1 alkyl hydroperoxide reductase [Skermanella stibiiresistens SB22]